MSKLVKEVFFNTNLSNILLEATVEEIKFSKKLNSAILIASSNLNISYTEIAQFEKQVEKLYELTSFKIQYKYTGDITEVTNERVLNILNETQNVYPYVKGAFNDCDITVSENNIKITLMRKYAGFLNLKNINECIAKFYKIKYGNNISVVLEDSMDAQDIVTSKPQIYEETKPKEEVKKSPIQTYEVKIPEQNGYRNNHPKLVQAKFIEGMPDNVIIGEDISTVDNVKIVKIDDSYDSVCIEGQICAGEDRELKTGKILKIIDVTDKTSTISCKMFLTKEEVEKLGKKLKVGNYVRVAGKAQIDPYAHDLVIMIASINTAGKPEGRKDTAKNKRVELHMHTQMSSMDGVSSATSLINQAIKWGHPAVAITDHGVVQAFPEANHVIMDNYTDLAKEKLDGKWPSTQEVLDAAPIKVLYGVEGYLVQDIEPEFTVPDTYCVFDLETTGFEAKYDKITEIACCKVKNGEIIDEFSTFVNPERSIPQRVQELTHITDDMVKDSPTIEEILPKFLDFIAGSILVAHNAKFDVGFIKHFAQEQKIGERFKPIVMDTLTIARELYNDVENHKLGTIAERLGVSLEGAHRAINDTRATVKVMLLMLEEARRKGINTDGYLYTNIDEDIRNLPTYHIIIFAKNYTGLKNLYKLVSYSHVTYFRKRPRISRSMLNRYRDGLIIGSACESGELYQSIVEKDPINITESIARYYDYLEIQPLGNNEFYTRTGRKNRNKEIIKLSHEEVKQVNVDIVNLGEKLNKLVVATCDVHFKDPEDEIYRRIIQAGQGYDDADLQAPLYFRTTDEMLKEFEYLGEEKAYEIVVTNTNKVADMCDRISPISDEKCPPHIEGCEQMIRDIAETRAKELYGENLPTIVRERLDKELDSIIKNGFSVMYIIAQKLVWKSNEDGYLVGSRGSVGSSFVANMTGITEVNSLKAHYRCPNCKHSDFSDYGCKNGFDLPDKQCPVCGTMYEKDGMDIPFETFLGFNGDKEPDIDLNFSGEYQAKAHQYTEVIFGKGTTYKAGTIGTVADKTAYGYVMKYLEERGKSLPAPEINRISLGCTGIKRTTGQHPGGIIVVPKGREIYEFCPVQHPADDPYSNIVTTHFDYHSIDKNLLKLDILGHDDPTMIRMLQDITGVDPKKIPLDDKDTMSIFRSTEALGVSPESIKSEVGTYGVPEYGTKFVRGMLVDTRPTTFDELIRISGLSHGTDVWLGNAQSLIEAGTVTLQEAICCRDDIMIYLIDKGLEPNPAFKIMETVRKGKALKDPKKWAEYKAMMKEHDVPDWYIESCEKIKYMFPKAHAAAYVTMAFRIAWFKVHIPKAYYAAFMSIRADEFDSECMLHGKEKVLKKMDEINLAGNSAAPKDKNMYPILELVLEMNERGINFLPVDLLKSDASKFLVEEDGIRPPFSALTGLGGVDAKKLVDARNEEAFSSIEDISVRAKIGKSSLEVLEDAGVLKGLARSSQIDMFDMLG